MRFLRLAAFVVMGLAVPAVAYADSDGYYCAGRGYLAYQFGMAPMPIAPHRVSVISVRGPRGIPEAATLQIPQFQVHGMLCGDGWIDIASFTTVYRITLDANDRPVRYEERESLKGQPIPQAFIQSQFQNLGPLGGRRAYVKPIRTALGVRPLGGEYILEVIAKPIEPVKSCEIAVTSRIVETDGAGREVNARIIFQGRGHRECGGGGLVRLAGRGPDKKTNEISTSNGDQDDDKHPGRGGERRLIAPYPSEHRQLPQDLKEEHDEARDGARSQDS